MAVDFELIDAEESWRIFDEAAHRLLNTDAETFIEKWSRGDYVGDAMSTRAMRVSMLKPGGW